jgi:hypothetical protein
MKNPMISEREIAMMTEITAYEDLTEVSKYCYNNLERVTLIEIIKTYMMNKAYS